MSKHDFHPVAEIFPLMTGAAFEELVADIKAKGLKQEILLHRGKIIDGRNRYLACEKAGVEPTYREWDGKGDLTAYIVSLNLYRRHLNESQRAMVAAKIAVRPEGRERKTETTGIPVVVPTIPRAAEMLNVNKSTVSDAKKIRREAPAEVVAAVEAGEMTVHAAIRKIDAESTKAFIDNAPARALAAAERDNPQPKRKGRGVEYAHQAIAILKKIPVNDALRVDGLNIVVRWIRDNK